MKLYDVPINFKVYADNENDAIWKVQRMLRLAIIEYALEKEVVEHDLFEFIPADATECSCVGCHDI